MKTCIKLILISICFVFLLSLKTFAAPNPMPVISRNVPAYGSHVSPSFYPSQANDDSYEEYYEMWDGLPKWLAYDLFQIPEAQRGLVIVAWYSSSSSYFESVSRAPQDYTIEAHTAEGETDPPSDGWQVLETVTGNIYHSRQHVIDMTGYNWIRIHVTSLVGSSPALYINMDIHDTHLGTDDSWFFVGDSITAAGMDLDERGDQNFPQIIHASLPDYYPAQENAGRGFWTSTHGAQYLPQWLNNFPGKYVAISFGTNDAMGGMSPEDFYSYYETMVNAVINAGKIPVIPTILPLLNKSADNVPPLNNALEQLKDNYPQIIDGPDLWTFFSANQDLFRDALHPSAEGYVEYRRLWAEKMLEVVYNAEPGNVVPLVEAGEDITVDEGETVNINATFTDSDSDTHTSTIDWGDGSDEEGVVDEGAKTITGSHVYNDNGTYTVIVTVKDDDGGSSSDNLSVTVVSDANAPLLAAIGNKTVQGGELLEFTISATDPDGDALTYSASNLPSGASFYPATQTFSWTPDIAQAGVYTGIIFEVTDGSLKDSEEITITVDEEPNTAPTFTIQNGDQAVNEGETITINDRENLTLRIVASDPDGDELIYSFTSDPETGGMNLSKTGGFSWTPLESQVGTYTLAFTVTDGKLSEFQSIYITVNERIPEKDGESFDLFTDSTGSLISSTWSKNDSLKLLSDGGGYNNTTEYYKYDYNVTSWWDVVIISFKSNTGYDFTKYKYLEFAYISNGEATASVQLRDSSGSYSTNAITIASTGSSYQVAKLDLESFNGVSLDSIRGIKFNFGRINTARGLFQFDEIRLVDPLEDPIEEDDPTAPTAPAELTAETVTHNSVTLTWTESTDNVGVTGYNIFRDSVQIGTSSTNSYTDSNLEPGTAYTYAVSAFDSSGNQSGQTQIQITTSDEGTPSTPTNLSVAATSPISICLSWDASTGDNLKEYRIYRDEGAEPIGIVQSTTYSYTDAKLQPEEKHSYTVTAYDQNGNESEHSNFVSATTDTAIEVTILDEAGDFHYKVDQFGYLPNESKVAVISQAVTGLYTPDDFTPGSTLQVRTWPDHEIVYDSEGAPVEGPPVEWNDGEEDSNAGDKGWWFDFSDVTTPGKYIIYDVDRDLHSHVFEIDENVYRKVLIEVARSFFYQREGVVKEVPYADPQWADNLSFAQDKHARYIDEDDNGNPLLPDRDVSGGWNDAGDYDKYVTNSDDTLNSLLIAYQYNPSIWKEDHNIPESENGIPDILDHVNFQIKWIMKMQDDDGGVFIKAGDRRDFTTMQPPSIHKETRYYGRKCSSSTIAAAATFAHAAYVFKDIPNLAAQAKELKDRAISAWNHFHANEIQTNCDNVEIRSSDMDVSAEQQGDDAAAAAVWLWALTGDETYHSYFKANYTDTECYSESWWSPYRPIYQDALLFYTTLDGRDSSVASDILSSKRSSSNSRMFYRLIDNQSLYRSYMPSWMFHWASNWQRADLGSINVNAIHYNIDTEDNESFRQRALGVLHWLHGVNPHGKVMLTNMYHVGAENSVNETFHLWFYNNTVWDSVIEYPFVGPAPGLLVGGPNSRNGGISGQPASKSYKEYNGHGSWGVTESDILYQASYIRLLSYFLKDF